MLALAGKRRAQSSHELNEHSSRSHQMLSLHVSTAGTGSRGSIYLVDLAGSERLNRTNPTKEQMLEAQHINKSLSALGDVVEALIMERQHADNVESLLDAELEKTAESRRDGYSIGVFCIGRASKLKNSLRQACSQAGGPLLPAPPTGRCLFTCSGQL